MATPCSGEPFWPSSHLPRFCLPLSPLPSKRQTNSPRRAIERFRRGAGGGPANGGMEVGNDEHEESDGRGSRMKALHSIHCPLCPLALEGTWWLDSLAPGSVWLAPFSFLPTGG